MHTLLVGASRGRFYVETLLKNSPDVVAALESARAYIVLFSPAWEPEDDDEKPTPGVVLERVRRALEEAERTLTARPGWPLYVCDSCGIGFPVALLARDDKDAPIFALRPRRGSLMGFLEGGEGGAVYITSSGESTGGWAGAREMVLAQLAKG